MSPKTSSPSLLSPLFPALPHACFPKNKTSHCPFSPLSIAVVPVFITLPSAQKVHFPPSSRLFLVQSLRFFEFLRYTMWSNVRLGHLLFSYRFTIEGAKQYKNAHVFLWLPKLQGQEM